MEAPRRAPQLSSGGKNVLSPREQFPDTFSDPGMKNMSNEEMESALKRHIRRPQERIRGGAQPQTARGLLEENKMLVMEKQEKKTMERKSSREFIEKLLADARMKTEADKAREINRRSTKQELSHYYKDKISEKESLKAAEYSQKLQVGSEGQFFPFSEGECIVKHRQVQAEKMRQEMRDHLQRQRKDHPPRADSLMADTSANGTNSLHNYPLMPMGQVKTRSTSSTTPRPPGDALDELGVGAVQLSGEEVAPHMARYPRFLSRAREHMSRRIHDQHVKSALEDKVQKTKEELEARMNRRHLEAASVEDGLLVNDAVRYDSSQSQAVERRKNAEYLMRQMKERRVEVAGAKKAEHFEEGGYWGPEEKGYQAVDVHQDHCTDLIRQMEVNQHRRLDSRNRRLCQERRLVDNSMAEMSQDRQREQVKKAQHREVLTTTWKSQQKIREVSNAIDQM